MQKSTIDKIIKAPYCSKIVKLLNGCFNVATCTVQLSTVEYVEYVLRVEVTHPTLYWQCGNVEIRTVLN